MLPIKLITIVIFFIEKLGIIVSNFNIFLINIELILLFLLYLKLFLLHFFILFLILLGFNINILKRFKKWCLRSYTLRCCCLWLYKLIFLILIILFHISFCCIKLFGWFILNKCINNIIFIYFMIYILWKGDFKNVFVLLVLNLIKRINHLNSINVKIYLLKFTNFI